MDPEEEARVRRALEQSSRSGPTFDPFGAARAPASPAEAALAESGQSAPVYDVLDEANRRIARQADEEAPGPTRARAAREDAALRAAARPAPLTYEALGQAARRPTHEEILETATDSCRNLNVGREPTERCIDDQYDQLNERQLGITPPPQGIGPTDPNNPPRSLPDSYGEDWDNIRAAMERVRNGSEETIPSPQAVENARAANHLARGGPVMALGSAGMVTSAITTGAPITTERVNHIGEIAAPFDALLDAAGDTAEARNTRHLPMSRSRTMIGEDGTGPDTWGIPADEGRLVVDPQAAVAADADTADGLVNEILREHATGTASR